MTKSKSPLPANPANDPRGAANVLRAARALLTEGETPFPVLEAARRAGVRTDSPTWVLIAQAREAVGGKRDEHQLEAAAVLIENTRGIFRASSPPFTRAPRCRLRATGGRCGRPIAHKHGCSLEPTPDDQVRSIGTDHVLLGGPPTDTTMIAAWAKGAAGSALRVRRDDHDRGLWIDSPPGQRRKARKPLLLGWDEVRRLVLDLNLELADRRPSADARGIKRQEKRQMKPVPGYLNTRLSIATSPVSHP